MKASDVVSGRFVTKQDKRHDYTRNKRLKRILRVQARASMSGWRNTRIWTWYLLSNMPAIERVFAAGFSLGRTRNMTPQIVPQSECDRLLERQSDARMWVRANPYAHLLNVAWKRFYKHSVHKSDIRPLLPWETAYSGQFYTAFYYGPWSLQGLYLLWLNQQNMWK